MEVENNNNLPVKFTEKRKATDEDEGDVTKRLKHDVPNNLDPLTTASSVSNSTHPPPQSPKKRLQIQKQKPRQNKDQNFMYGNYKHYYGKRILDKDFHDIRLDVLATQPELFQDKQLLDIGCNSGHLSIEIAKRFNVKSLVGLDIDRSLVNDAQMAIGSLKRQNPPGSRFPYNLRFLQGNYVLEDDVLLEIERPQFDVILCLSVTKWIHLNFCDAGLKQAFRRMFLQLRTGGKLILEPQSFDTYKRRKKLSEKIRENYNAIELKPNKFTEYLLSPEVGFATMELMGVPDHCESGFKRPIQIFTKRLVDNDS
ncbi:probable RNA methyltransferase CG1239 [Drosophila tropicalis]|uniref:probable RNA methyltransferase CG1239 n=1 Tax=Drosophila tropicalis TaxID=46794 RepID=UPI0035AB9384